MIGGQQDMCVWFGTFLVNLGQLFNLAFEIRFLHVVYDHAELLLSVHQELVLGNK